MKEFTLDGNNISVKGIEFISKALEKNHTITTLYLGEI